MTYPANAPEVDASALRSFVERVERLNEEIGQLNADKASIFAEVKSAGFDQAIVKKVIRLRAMDRDKRIEEETILGLYLAALGVE